MAIDGKYILIEKLNEGSFGSIYKCKNVRTNEYGALKLENKNSKYKTLKNEAKIYQYLGKLDGFPSLRWYGTTEKYNYMIIDLLDSSLVNIIQKYGKLCLKSVLLIGLQMIIRIRDLHSKKLVHRDLKPENFMVGLDNQSNKIYLIDFSFSKTYMNNQKHIEEKIINKLIGTPNYVSLNVHNGVEPSRRDDIESIIYILYYCLYGYIPWNNCQIRDIYEKKKNLEDNYAVSAFIRVLLTYVRSLKFKDVPDYTYICSILKKEFSENNLTNTIEFEWLHKL
jgi:serine/threonine protein kinase